MSDNNKTRAWRLYEAGRDYNTRLVPSQYQLVETNTEFFNGNQWLHLPDTPAMRDLPKPTFNILKRIASLFIASLTSSGVTVHFEPLAYYGMPQNAPMGGGPPLDEGPALGGWGATGGANPPQGSADGDGGQAAPQGGLSADAVGGSRNFISPFSQGLGGAEDGGGMREDVSDVANAEVMNLLEKFKFDYRIRDALYAGAQTGDYCAHFWFDPDASPYGGAFGHRARGEIRMELVDGINVLFGNPNTSSVEDQPWILLVGRDTVEHLRQEMEQVRRNRSFFRRGTDSDRQAANGDAEIAEASSPDDIQADTETRDFPGVGGRTELTPDQAGSGKALYVLLYTKEERTVGERLPDGTVRQKRVTSIRVTKATKTAVIYENVDTGLSVYPIAWGNWERQRNQYHGRALVTSVIPNQIFINTMFANAMRHLQLMAFPKTVFNADLIPEWTNEIGQAIGVRGLLPGQSIPQVAANLQAPEISGQIFALIDKAMSYTKDCLGATDAQLGNVKPDNTSAIMVLQTNAEVPLENIRACLHEWTEDIGKILLDMMGTYYGRRPVVVERPFREFVMDENTGVPLLDDMGQWVTRTATRKVAEDFDFSIFKRLWLNLKVDVGATTVFSEIALTQTLDNLRRDGLLTARQYLERLPDKLLTKKDEVLRDLDNAIAQQTPAPSGGLSQSGGPSRSGGAAGLPAQGGALDASKALRGVPQSTAATIARMPEYVNRLALNSSAAGQMM